VKSLTGPVLNPRGAPTLGVCALGCLPLVHPAATAFETVVNLKAAKAIDVTIPE
jgi:hypothetical protein